MLSFGLKKRVRRALADQRYIECVQRARDERLYRDLSVADNIDGRFDALILYVALLVRALNTQGNEGAHISALVLEALISDLDRNIREMGVGDLSVGKKVKAMMSAYQGRSTIYANALDAADRGTLKDAVIRNLYRGEVPSDDISEAMLDRIVADADSVLRLGSGLLEKNQRVWEMGQSL